MTTLNMLMINRILLLFFTSLLIKSIEAKNGYDNADEYSDTHAAVDLHRNKEIVFFAGPHKSGATSVEKFFSKWAVAGWLPRHPHTKALEYWRWPIVKGPADKDLGYKVYGDLVKSPDNKELEGYVLKSVKEKFEESENGVILGTEEFDQVGDDAMFDALSVMKKIQTSVGVENADVTVVLNYRVPRLDQWTSIWAHAEDDYKEASYSDFMCNTHNNGEDKKYRYSMIGAEMNPLGAALTFLKQGYRVVVIDMGGLEKEGKDVVHTIGCDVLVGGCEHGVLGALGEYLPHENSVEKDLNELNEEESGQIEKLFRYRDCGYLPLLSSYMFDGVLEVLHQDSIWEKCDEFKPNYYAKFIDNTPMMYNALLGQLECKSNPHHLGLGKDMNEALKGPSSGFFSGGDGGDGSNTGLFHVVFMPIILLGAVGFGIYRVQTQQMPAGSSPDEDGITEMTQYPHSASDGGDFRDDVELDDSTDLSDNNSNPIT